MKMYNFMYLGICKEQITKNQNNNTFVKRNVIFIDVI